MHKKDIRTAGRKLGEAPKVLIMLHGRGSTAEDILGLSSHLSVADFTIIAPQATNNSWYPYSFLAPVKQNEPWLSSALKMLEEIVSDIENQGIKNENVFVTGFSQGACLTLEFVARNAKAWGGIAAFTGGLIGDRIYRENYAGSFQKTPVFIGSADPDPHVPVERVHETAKVLQAMDAVVIEKIYPGIGHTITAEEIAMADAVIFKR